jgi:hypothetical protein
MINSCNHISGYYSSTTKLVSTYGHFHDSEHEYCGFLDQYFWFISQQKERDHYVDLEVGGKIILKLIL